MDIATYYFAGKLEKLIPLQKGSNFDRIISKFRSTVWDIYLLKFPPLMLSGTKPPIPLAKICTCERELAYIGRKFFVWKLFSDQKDFFPAFLTDYSDLAEIYSEEIMQKLLQLHKDFEAVRAARKLESVVLLNDTQIRDIKLALEDELKHFLTK